MRKFMILLCVGLLVVMMAVPTFALGNGTGQRLYSPMQFDAFYTDRYGPLEWMYNFTNYGRNEKDYFNSGGDSAYDAGFYLGYSSNDSGDVSGWFSTGGSAFTLSANSQVMKPDALKGYKIRIDNGRLKNYSVYGSYAVVRQGSDGKLSIESKNFSKTVQAGSNIIESFDLGQLLLDAVAGSPHYDSLGMYFLSVSFDWSTELYVEDDAPEFYVSIPRTIMTNYQQTTPQYWLTRNMGKFSMMTAPEMPDPDFNLGTWLADTVDGFLDFEIAPGFSLDKLIYIVLIIGVFLWLITILI